MTWENKLEAITRGLFAAGAALGLAAFCCDFCPSVALAEESPAGMVRMRVVNTDSVAMELEDGTLIPPGGSAMVEVPVGTENVIAAGRVGPLKIGHDYTMYRKNGPHPADYGQSITSADANGKDPSAARRDAVVQGDCGGMSLSRSRCDAVLEFVEKVVSLEVDYHPNWTRYEGLEERLPQIKLAHSYYKALMRGECPEEMRDVMNELIWAQVDYLPAIQGWIGAWMAAIEAGEVYLGVTADNEVDETERIFLEAWVNLVVRQQAVINKVRELGVDCSRLCAVWPESAEILKKSEESPQNRQGRCADSNGGSQAPDRWDVVEGGFLNAIGDANNLAMSEFAKRGIADASHYSEMRGAIMSKTEEVHGRPVAGYYAAEFSETPLFPAPRQGEAVAAYYVALGVNSRLGVPIEAAWEGIRNKVPCIAFDSKTKRTILFGETKDGRYGYFLMCDLGDGTFVWKPADEELSPCDFAFTEEERATTLEMVKGTPPEISRTRWSAGAVAAPTSVSVDENGVEWHNDSY